MDFLIESNEYFRIEHCYSCAVPGYLIVSPTIVSKSVHELPQSFQQQLGPSLALATKLTQEFTKPLKVYCAQFGEEGNHLHFHVFPRTRQITNAYLDSFPEQSKLIHGPVLLDWARSEYKISKEGVWSIVESAVVKMRKQVATFSSGATFVTGSPPGSR